MKRNNMNKNHFICSSVTRRDNVAHQILAHANRIEIFASTHDDRNEAAQEKSGKAACKTHMLRANATHSRLAVTQALAIGR